MDPVCKIENWSTQIDNDPWLPPEEKETILVGEVYGHPMHKDGKRIQTSHIVSAVGRTITSKSGSIYELGKRHPEFEQFLVENNYPLDEENPIKLVKQRTHIYKKPSGKE